MFGSDWVETDKKHELTPAQVMAALESKADATIDALSKLWDWGRDDSGLQNHTSDDISRCGSILKAFKEQKDGIQKSKGYTFKTHYAVWRATHVIGNDIITLALSKMDGLSPHTPEQVLKVCEVINGMEALSDYEKQVARYTLKMRYLNRLTTDYEDLEKQLEEFRKKLRR